MRVHSNNSSMLMKAASGIKAFFDYYETRKAKIVETMRYLLSVLKIDEVDVFA